MATLAVGGAKEEEVAVPGAGAGVVVVADEAVEVELVDGVEARASVVVSSKRPRVIDEVPCGVTVESSATKTCERMQTIPQ